MRRKCGTRMRFFQWRRLRKRRRARSPNQNRKPKSKNNEMGKGGMNNCDDLEYLSLLGLKFFRRAEYKVLIKYRTEN